MRILFGVVGEGMGHATRSKVVCEHLVASGHQVKLVVSNRAYAYLAGAFPDVVQIKGLTLRYEGDAMDRGGTLAQNLLAAPSLIVANLNAYWEKVVRFDADLVMTDFDSFAHLFAKRHGIPVVSVDNHQMLARCKHDDAIKKGYRTDFQITKAFVRAKIPACDHYVITSFFYAPLRKKSVEDTTIVPPILRSGIIEAKRRARLGEHVLVYQTAATNEGLIPALNALSHQQFVVYGMRRNDQIGNCVLKEFSEDGFIRDLESARAVVTNGGMSLLGESVYLGKPIYSVPVRNQFEQIMNSRYVEQLGYGVSVEKLAQGSLRRFLRDLPRYAQRLARYEQDGNRAVFGVLDRLIADAARRKKKKSA